MKFSKIESTINNINITSLFVVLNLIAILFYIFFAVKFNYLDKLESTIWSVPLTEGYRNVADYLFDGLQGSPPYASEYRPFLYPLILGSCRYFSNNAYAVWFMQFIFWILSLNLTALSVRGLTKRRLFIIITFVIFAANISIIALTFKAVTVTTIIFLLSLWIFLFMKYDISNLGLTSVFLLTFVLSLLAVIKPVFQLHLLLFLLYVFFKHIRRLKIYPVILIALIPVIMQLSFMVAVHNVFSLSTISEITFKRYLAAKVYAIVEHNSLDSKSIDQARSKTHNSDYWKLFKYFYKHPYHASVAYLQNVIIENMLVPSHFAGDLMDFTRKTNTFFFYLHFIFFPLLIYTLFAARNDLSFKMVFLYVFFMLIIITAGISFWQGDRLTIVSLPLWLIVYTYVLNSFFLGDFRHYRKTALVKSRTLGKTIAVSASIFCLFISFLIPDALVYSQGRVNGFYYREKWPDGTYYRWTDKEALIKLKKGGLVELTFICSHPDVEMNPVFLSVSLGSSDLDKISFIRKGAITRRYYIPETITKNMELIFKISRTWNPKKMGVNLDKRNLGVAVSEIKYMNMVSKQDIGFYDWENLGMNIIPGWPHDAPQRFRWTGKQATIKLGIKSENGLRLFLMCAHPKIDEDPILVDILGDDKLILQEKFSNNQWKDVLLAPAELKDRKTLTIQVSRTWNPKASGYSEDDRDLGVAVAVLKSGDS